MPKTKRQSLDMEEQSVAMTQRQLNFSIPSFNGECDTVDWFIDSVLSMQQLNGWEDEVALLYLKTKLAGPALKWYISSPSAQKSCTLVEMCDKIRKFFAQETTVEANLAALQAVFLLPGESVKSLAHRVEQLVEKTFPYIKDRGAMENLKVMHLNSALPPNIKEKLIGKELKVFDELVQHAQLVKVGLETVQLVQHHMDTVRSSDQQDNKIADLTTKVEKLANQKFESRRYCLFKVPYTYKSKI